MSSRQRRSRMPHFLPPLPLQARVSRLGDLKRISPMTACHWRLLTWRIVRAQRMTPPRCHHSPPPGSTLHTMVVLQFFQAKLLRSMDESGPDPAAFRELCSTTDLVLCATKTTAQAIGSTMASLVVLERHLWLNLTEVIKDADRLLLSSLRPCGGLFSKVLHHSTEVVTGNAPLPAQALQLCSSFNSPEKRADSAAREACAFDRSAQARARASTALPLCQALPRS